MPKFTWEQWEPLLISYGTSLGLTILHILLILILGWVAIRFVRKILNKLSVVMLRFSRDEDSTIAAAEKRVATLTGLLSTIARVGIWSIVAVVILTEVGVDIAPILTGAGIAGLAVGFGAQNLVRDVISGFFIVLENQIRVGDVAVINGTGGLVEQISFRTITLRDLSGVVHIFPNGTISTLANMTKTWSAAVLDIGVAYHHDTDQVVEIMREVYEDLRNDPEFGPKIIGDFEVFGVDSFGDNAVTIRARIKTQPIQQWAIGREYRRRLKHAFDARDITIPFPQRTLHFANPPFPQAA
ncbi:MAG: hypothetical protein Kow0074_15100 [Candidatus Zixiibacteriota bacterium]